MNPFKERRAILMGLKKLKDGSRKTPPAAKPAANVFTQCPGCKQSCSNHQLSANHYTCPQCGYHLPLAAYHRLSTLLDSGTFKELNRDFKGQNLLNFPDYDEKLDALRRETGLTESVVTGRGSIDGIRVVICVMDSRFMMGSMGAACGEKITRAIEYATKKRLPLIIFSASGGARMQEGIFSLCQMAKTSAAIKRHSDGGLLFLSVLTHPTTGGVTASFASLGDIILAEPGALIGFAGPRVIEQTIGETLPDGFQRAEYLKEHGFVDGVVPRKELRPMISNILRLHTKGAK